MPQNSRGLESFLPVVSRWFVETFGEPTPPQSLGWPAISEGRNTLIFAPTGSGKTLAAFLACLDVLWRSPARSPGVRILYVSPLKALNQDISRNLELPLRGVAAFAEREGVALPVLSVGVRSGDTTPSERQRLARRPPDILITTPESLHLILTSKVRETLRTVTHVIVDEIHAVCANKRGIFLSILLERLEAQTPNSYVRIGLSATQRPLDEVARYLGGRRPVKSAGGRTTFEPRPVTIVDAGRRKDLDLEVIAPFAHAQAPRGSSVWPLIEQRLWDLIRGHRSTIVFANNRRIAERLTAHLNERMAELEGEEKPSDGVPDVLVRSHHGSLSIEERRTTEELLKSGDLPAVVATASLELGIDMGAVDLVCQVESPGSVSRGLQRVGRAGHIVGRVSKGRLLAKTSSDLVESAALCRQMISGEVEALKVPTNCLDVLAQQVVACVAVDRWDVPALFDLFRSAYPYRDLTAEAFESVLKMVSGRFKLGSFRDLRARIAWDRVHNRLAALPGSARLAVTSGGTIPDTGQYPVYFGDGGPRLGELDEEFVLERRVGETFVLGTATWRIEAIDPLRVVVARAEGQSALMPFWRGESTGRTAQLGRAVGELCRTVAERLEGGTEALDAWLVEHYRLDANGARVIREYVARQRRSAGVVPDDRTVLVEAYRDSAGETGLAVLSPFGGKLHHALKLVLESRLRQRLGIDVACLHDDDGLLIRLPQTEEPPLDIFEGLTPALAERLIREGLGDSALFGLRFRQNAGRALLMPRPDPSKRTPLYLQRLRAKDLLQVVRKHADFPIVIETYRECLDDDLDLPGLRAFLENIAAGRISVATRRGETPSPFVSELLFKFEHHYLYQWDEPKRGPGKSTDGPEVEGGLLDSLLEDAAAGRWVDAAAVGRVESRLRGVGRPPRSAEEAAELLRTLGDLSPSELAGPTAGFLAQLETEGRAFRISMPGTLEPERWIADEERDLYASAFDVRDGDLNPARDEIVRRFLQTHALVGLADLTARYPIDPALATDCLERWADEGSLVKVEPVDGEPDVRWADRENLAEVRRLSVALRRRETVAVAPEVFADVVLRHQGVHPETRREGPAALGLVIEQLQGHAATAGLWEGEIFPGRVKDYRPAWLDETLAAGDFTWRASADGRGGPKVAFIHRDFPYRAPAVDDSVSKLSEVATAVLGRLAAQGAAFATDLSRVLGLEPSRLRAALDELLGRGLVTNDRFDPLRPGSDATVNALAAAASAAKAWRSGSSRPRFSGRRTAASRPEGRWDRARNLDAETPAGDETECLAWASILLDRYGVLTRETVGLDPWAPPWRDLVPWLGRAELRGEVRRGYFVEGLSGVQYATEEFSESLSQRAAAFGGVVPPVLISTLDPANLYGSSAPFDVELLEGGTARLPRSESNYLVLCAGRPVLIIEGHGKRLTGLASADEAELRAAVGLLPTLARSGRRVLKVEQYNGAATLASPAVPWLTEAGFVRDHPGMAYYAGW